VLDLGCGAGQDARDLKRARYAVIGLDFTRPLLQYARRQSPSLCLVQADIRYLPYRAGRFDMVWAAASLIHLPKSSVRKSLRELYRLVTPGGIIAATFIHGRRSGIDPDRWIPDRFISRWLKPELAMAVGEAGWTIDRLTTVSNRERHGRWLNLIARQTLP
jgi:ubiquinone/menaquinone biosynthesis C-methylase UbiE